MRYDAATMIISKLFAALALIMTLTNGSANDFQIIKKRLYQDQLIKGGPEEIGSWKLEELKEWVATIKVNGSWPDIDYTALNDVRFPPITHVLRMEYLAQAYATPGHTLYKNSKLLETVWRAYDHWCEKNYLSYNWWMNEIGVPLRFERVMILLEDSLTKERRQKGYFFLSKATLSKTGQNLLWQAEIVLTHGLLSENATLTRNAIKAIQDEVKISTNEGIRSDNSFHQHGNLIFSGGYGAGFSHDAARIIGLTQGTFAAFSKEKFDIIANYILDGQMWVSRNDKFDYGVFGREIARKTKTAQLLGDACKMMMDFPSERQKEFEACYNKIITKSAGPVAGNKHFWHSDMMVHHRKDFYASVRMYSDRTFNNDAPSNSEGLLSHHTADGATLIMKDGSEYEDIFPVWDWRKIPGTTVEQKVLKPAYYVPGDWDGFAHLRYKGSSTFVGGLSDGHIGIAAMDFKSNKRYEKLDAKKSWFFFDEGFLALGNSIKCPGCKHVATTLDQSLLKSKVQIVDAKNNLIDQNIDSADYQNIKAVLHNKVAFIFPESQKISVSNKRQTGSWFRINEQYDNSPVEKDVFSAWINHGANAVEDSSYSYIVLPNITTEKLLAYRPQDYFTTVNTPFIQAVYHLRSGVLQAVFYKAGKVTFKDQMLEVNSPCLVMIKNNSLMVADPSQQLNSVKIIHNNKSYSIDLPQGQSKGKTIALKI
jgi:chondroitin AC lyase